MICHDFRSTERNVVMPREKFATQVDTRNPRGCPDPRPQRRPLAELLAIHDDQIERYGGSSGVCDLGLLEAALFRPQTGYYADLLEEARRPMGKPLGEPFPSSTVTRGLHSPRPILFSPSNVARITANAQTAYDFIAGLYEANDVTFSNLAVWLRANVAF
jgi:death-on-curing protein